jgi:hypothetical protein
MCYHLNRSAGLSRPPSVATQTATWNSVSRHSTSLLCDSHTAHPPTPRKATTMSEATSTYAAKIASFLGKLGTNSTKNPDEKHNVGRVLGELFLWSQVEKYAKNRKDGTQKTIDSQGMVETNGLTPGNHELAVSPSFLYVAKVSAPYMRFNEDELAELLNKSKYKVPHAVTKELISKAKLPTKSAVTRTIMERS